MSSWVARASGFLEVHCCGCSCLCETSWGTMCLLFRVLYSDQLLESLGVGCLQAILQIAVCDVLCEGSSLIKFVQFSHNICVNYTKNVLFAYIISDFLVWSILSTSVKSKVC